MERASVLEAFDAQMRRDPVPDAGSCVEVEDRVTRILADGPGWNGVMWSNLSADDAETVIAAQIRRFSSVRDGWEWKWYSHDTPDDLPVRLRSAGFVPDADETLLVAEIADLSLDQAPPPGVELVPVVDRDGVEDLVAVHDEVFGGSHSGTGRALLAALDAGDPSVSAVVARADGAPIAAGRVELPRGRDFASLWGGGTVPAWRGRGVFRSLVSHRAALAERRGYRYLQVDALPASQPILERLGFVKLAGTRPYRR